MCRGMCIDMCIGVFNVGVETYVGTCTETMRADRCRDMRMDMCADADIVLPAPWALAVYRYVDMHVHRFETRVYACSHMCRNM